MKDVLSKRVPAAWLFIILIASAATGLIWKVAILDAPPQNAVLITADAGAATPAALTPLVGVGPAQPLTAATPTLLSSRPAATRPPALAASNPSTAPTVTIPVASPVSQTDALQAPPPTATPGTIEVYVSGAVSKPGLYTLPQGARIGDAVAAAGGAADGADLERLNLAARLEDEDHLAVPLKSDTPVPAVAAAPTQPATAQPPQGIVDRRAHPTATRQPPAQGADGVPATPAAPAAGSTPPASSGQRNPPPAGKININTATEQDLETLPSIGPTLAARIIDYRTSHGPFQAIEDIQKVSGIKAGIFAKVRDYITVGP